MFVLFALEITGRTNAPCANLKRSTLNQCWTFFFWLLTQSECLIHSILIFLTFFQDWAALSIYHSISGHATTTLCVSTVHYPWLFLSELIRPPPPSPPPHLLGDCFVHVLSRTWGSDSFELEYSHFAKGDKFDTQILCTVWLQQKLPGIYFAFIAGLHALQLISSNCSNLPISCVFLFHAFSFDCSFFWDYFDFHLAC